NMRAGRRLFRVHAAFDLMSIDKGLEDLKRRLKPIGEVITYLPSAEPGADDKIELDVLLGSDSDPPTIVAALEGTPVTVFEVPRKAGGGPPNPPGGGAPRERSTEAKAPAAAAPAPKEASKVPEGWTSSISETSEIAAPTAGLGGGGGGGEGEEARGGSLES